MSTVSKTRSDYWTSHFVALAKDEASGAAQIDFSNHALVVQNYAYILEAVGPLSGKSVLDAGFGTGDLSQVFDILGAEVSAIDVVSTRIPHLREQVPSVAWWQADLSEWTLPSNQHPFDIVVALESLQYVDFDDAIQRLLSAVAEGGRLVILIPNADCPIVQRTTERFDRQYVGVSMAQLPTRMTRILSERDDRVRDWRVAYRGISFQKNQTLVPYQSGPWLDCESRSVPAAHFRSTAANSMNVPNRLQIVFQDLSNEQG